MITKYAKDTDIPALRRLWKQAFGDSDQFLDTFFSIAYAPDRCLCGWEDKQLVSAIYWLDTYWGDQKIAYGYALATDEAYRGRGFCHKLLESLRKRLQEREYQGILLMVENEKMLKFYMSMGYEEACGFENFTIPAVGDIDPNLRKITWEQYARYTPQLLPPGSIMPSEEIYRIADTYMDFYRADAGIFCCTIQDEPEGRCLKVYEFLGDPKGLFAIAKAMGCELCKVRLKGSYPYGAFRRLVKGKTVPRYFGLPMD